MSDKPNPAGFPPDFSALVKQLQLSMRKLTAALEKMDAEKVEELANPLCGYDYFSQPSSASARNLSEL